MLWHIMKTYAHYGFTEFVVALGYKGEVIKDYFINYCYHQSTLTVSLKEGAITVHDGEREDWIIHLLDTGLATNTGGRVKRAAQFIGPEPFMLTYGDGVCTVDMARLLAFHQSHGRRATITAVRPPARFGYIRFDRYLVSRFEEKPQAGEGWINGGFMVVEPEIVDYIAGDETFFEREPLEQLATEGQLAAYQHEGFWQCMDTLRDVRFLQALWEHDRAPWKIWEQTSVLA